MASKNVIGISKLFYKFNTAPLSSAPAGRLFSYGKAMKYPQQAKLGVAIFECLVFLISNVEIHVN